MLTAVLDGTGNYLIYTDTYIYNERLKKIPGVRFDYVQKIWWSPRQSIFAFDKEFHGEVYYKTPLWAIEGQQPPDYTTMYSIDPAIKIPEMKTPLYGYQEFGARFMIDRIRKHGFVINADSVGTGKTCQAIAVMKYLAENSGAKHFLIIGKKSIKYQWAEEIDKFSDLKDRYKIWYTPETKKKRVKTYKEASENEFSILITNYHNFLNDVPELQEFDPDFCIIDEAHSVKARDGVLNNNIASVVRGTPTAFLTGTPVMSRPEDIFGIIQISDPDYFGSWRAFSNEYLVLSNKFGYCFVAGVKNLDKLHQKVQDIVIRRTEYEVSVQMPEVMLHNIKVEPSKQQIEMETLIDSQQKEYEDSYSYFEERYKLDKNDTNAIKGMKQASDGMKSLIAAKQTVSTDPLIFRESSSKFAMHMADALPAALKLSPKTQTILDLVSDIVESGEKVILFSKFVMTCIYFQKLFEKNRMPALMYTGLENDEQRTANINRFRTSDNANILIGSDAMAEGLNLAEARHVVNIDIPDTYAIYMQRFGRIRRVSSQYKNVVVHNVLTEGMTDITKYDKIMKNKDLDGALVAADSAQSKALIAAQGG